MNRKYLFAGGAIFGGVALLAYWNRDKGSDALPFDDYSDAGEPKKLLSKDKTNKDPFADQPCKPGVGSCSVADTAALKNVYKSERRKLANLKKSGASETQLNEAYRRLNFIGLRYYWARRVQKGLPKGWTLSQFNGQDYPSIDFSLDTMNDGGDFGAESEFDYGPDPNVSGEDDFYMIAKTGDTGMELFEDELGDIATPGTPGDLEPVPGYQHTQPYDNGQGFAEPTWGLQPDSEPSFDIDFDSMMGYSLGASPTAFTAADVIREAQKAVSSGLKGKHCWDFVWKVYNKAGMKRTTNNLWLFSGSQYRYPWRKRDGKRTKNQWVKMHNVPFLPEGFYDEIRPGDWLYIFNKSTGPDGGHSFIFTGWEDKSRRIAKGIGNWGANKAGKYQKFNLKQNPVTHWMRPPGEQPPSSITLGRWYSEFTMQQEQYYRSHRGLHGFQPEITAQQAYAALSPQQRRWLAEQPICGYHPTQWGYTPGTLSQSVGRNVRSFRRGRR